jgi:hypothetical protein
VLPSPCPGIAPALDCHALRCHVVCVVSALFAGRVPNFVTTGSATA